MALIDHSFGKRVKEAIEARSLYYSDVIDIIKTFGLKRPIGLRTLRRIAGGKYYSYSPRAKAQIVRALPELR